MDIKYIQTSKLNPAKYNPREISEESLKALKKSIEEFGFVEPIVVNKDMTVIGGHQRLKVAIELNMNEVPCNVIDVDKHIEMKLNVLLNSQAISGYYKEDSLVEILEQLKNDKDYKELRLDVLEPMNFDDELEEEEIEKDKPIKISITFQSVEDMQNAKAEIQSILNNYDGYSLSVSGGEL